MARFFRYFTAFAALAVVLAAGASAGGSGLGAGITGTPTVAPIALDDAQLTADDEVTGGAKVSPTDRTVAHWFGSTTNPQNGVTYGYNMVGADPNNCTACSTTFDVDITPIVVNIDGLTFDGNAVAPATIGSPLFTTNDYGSTSAASTADHTRGPGGTLSAGDAGVPLQLEDATMRMQFGKTGSAYHVLLTPHLLPSVTINVPKNQGTLIRSPRGVFGANIDAGWWSSQISNLETSADPTHLALYLTNQVYLYDNNNPGHCCVIGFHGTKASGLHTGGAKGQGNGAVQTFAWASYMAPGFYAHANGGTDWAMQDIHSLSHEISEWADDPFGNNAVEPWSSPTAPQYGCTAVLETGDPVVDVGFAIGANTFAQGPNPDGSQSADGSFHPEDEAFLPWFMRTSADRYTLMGPLNPFATFQQPAPGC